ncbi:calcineurin-like phosphoesterase family protein [Antricoccus suffuscus]|uniref:Calcineurin-like phosphoesterase family protein n=1 Tax=Antricoccus suffuscus TaxID=1629062 RepID=A0A2T1A490_9ACTN|nr:metallophosphoesterase [Antricoccus suffuscus]PRZ43138.1 calcineurin-like phosphoesterase family protein [Antricoccus suffuscus]
MSSRSLRRRSSARLLPQRLAGMGLALVGTGLGMRLAGRSRINVGPAVLDVAIVFGRSGGTTVRVPPLGEARLATHKGPLRADARLVGVDVTVVRELIGAQKFALELPPLTPALVKTAARSGLGGVAGAAALAAITRRTAGSALTATITSVGALAGAGAVAAASLDKQSWRTPHLTGLLTRAPQLVGDVKHIPAQFSRYRKQLSEIAASVTGVFRGLGALPDAPPDDAIRLVHLSDIHNNPLAYAVAKSLVAQYAADAVLDTGDIGDWGTPQEAKTFEDVGTIGAPYVFVKGNHDSDKTLAALRKHDNVRILDGGATTDIAGLTIAGQADPRFTPDKSTGGDHVTKDALAAVGRQFADTVKGRSVDIALTHDPVVAAQLAGLVPLVLAGHTHKRGERRIDGTLLLTQGSSGGAGLRGVRQVPPDPLTASVLHIDRKRHTLVAVDEFTFGGLGRTEVSLVRRTAADLAPPASEATTPVTQTTGQTTIMQPPTDQTDPI